MYGTDDWYISHFHVAEETKEDKKYTSLPVSVDSTLSYSVVVTISPRLVVEAAQRGFRYLSYSKL